MNHLQGLTIEIEVPLPLIVNRYIDQKAGPGNTASVQLGAPPPPTPPVDFRFEVWELLATGSKGYKISANSDPRVRPR